MHHNYIQCSNFSLSLALQNYAYSQHTILLNVLIAAELADNYNLEVVTCDEVTSR